MNLDQLPLAVLSWYRLVEYFFGRDVRTLRAMPGRGWLDIQFSRSRPRQHGYRRRWPIPLGLRASRCSALCTPGPHQPPSDRPLLFGRHTFYLR